MKTLFRFLTGIIVPALLLWSCADDYTIDVFGTISGLVTDSTTGEPISVAQVTLIPGANTIQTAADGAFSFTRLDEGQYTVSVQKDGYQANRKNVAVVSGETTNVVITLYLIPKN